MTRDAETLCAPCRERGLLCVARCCECLCHGDVPGGEYAPAKGSTFAAFAAKVGPLPTSAMATRDKPPPAWRTVLCPTCEAKAGESCGRSMHGMPWGWVRTSPHIARKRAAAKGPTP